MLMVFVLLKIFLLLCFVRRYGVDLMVVFLHSSCVYNLYCMLPCF
jgi:hypothetical protein